MLKEELFLFIFFNFVLFSSSCQLFDMLPCTAANDPSCVYSSSPLKGYVPPHEWLCFSTTFSSFSYNSSVGMEVEMLEMTQGTLGIFLDTDIPTFGSEIATNFSCAFFECDYHFSWDSLSSCDPAKREWFIGVYNYHEKPMNFSVQFSLEVNPGIFGCPNLNSFFGLMFFWILGTISLVCCIPAVALCICCCVQRSRRCCKNNYKPIPTPVTNYSSIQGTTNNPNIWAHVVPPTYPPPQWGNEIPQPVPQSMYPQVTLPTSYQKN